MANALKGEVALPYGGGNLTLVFDINALAEAEDALNLNTSQIVQQMGGRWRLKFTRSLLWSALREHHPEIDLRGCGRIMQELTPGVVEEAVLVAVRAAFPAPKEETAPADPPVAAVSGTG